MEHDKPEKWLKYLESPRVLSQRVYVNQRTLERQVGGLNALEHIVRENAAATKRIESKVDKLLQQHGVRVVVASDESELPAEKKP